MEQGTVLRELNGQKVLYVDGEPFLILSFQLNCDSCYDPARIDRLLKHAAKIGANSVALMLYWRLVEPEEGRYDMSILEAMLSSADRYGLKIVLVWFGTYKNSTIHYAPDWLIEDEKRFPRVVKKDGTTLRYVACQNGQETLKKDAAAVEKVFLYLREHDTKRAVILFQVNNETGILGGTDRCYCKTCQKKYAEGRYEERYPGRAEEAFSAESNLDYQEEIARRAKAVYEIPCYMNAWLNTGRPDAVAGRTYPSGGPVDGVLDIYYAGKKQIDFVAPDIYMTGYRDFMRICGQYKAKNNPLYIAEHGLGKQSRAYKNIYYGIGEFAILGFDPWAIDCAFPNVTEQPMVDAVTECWSGEAYDMADSYLPIRNCMVPVMKYMGTERLKYWVQEEGEGQAGLSFGDVSILVTYQGAGSPELVFGNQPQEPVSDSRGIAIRLDEKHFVTLGCNSFIQFFDENGNKLPIKKSMWGHFEGEQFIPEALNTVAFGTTRTMVWQVDAGVCLHELY
jgi:hypothetical protein